MLQAGFASRLWDGSKCFSERVLLKRCPKRKVHRKTQETGYSVAIYGTGWRLRKVL